MERKSAWHSVLMTTIAMCSLPAMAGTDPVVHLKFDDASALGLDSSASGNDATIHNSPTFDAAGISGGAASMDGDYFEWAGESHPVENVLEGSFTFSVWVNTTQVGGGGNAGFAFQGASIVYADVPGTPPGPAADTIPMALTGSKLAGFVGFPHMHSLSDINTGIWVHLVAVRDLATDTGGFYVNGELETNEPQNSSPAD
ncbi:MAG: LamG-like jellyroll fold domain-containing protein [Phycisphaerae bacterium]